MPVGDFRHFSSRTSSSNSSVLCPNKPYPRARPELTGGRLSGSTPLERGGCSNYPTLSKTSEGRPRRARVPRIRGGARRRTGARRGDRSAAERGGRRQRRLPIPVERRRASEDVKFVHDHLNQHRFFAISQFRSNNRLFVSKLTRCADQSRCGLTPMGGPQQQKQRSSACCRPDRPPPPRANQAAAAEQQQCRRQDCAML